jgi:hypothetical protein
VANVAKTRTGRRGALSLAVAQFHPAVSRAGRQKIFDNANVRIFSVRFSVGQVELRRYVFSPKIVG